MLGRSVSRSKWEPKKGFAADEVPSDTVTTDLKSHGNTISLWEFEDGKWEEVALAIAAAAEHVDNPIDIAWLPRDVLVNDGIEIRQVDGRTAVSDLRQAHYEAYDLDGFRLARLAKHLAAHIRQGNISRLTRRQVIDLLNAAHAAGRIDLSALEPKVKAVIKPLPRPELPRNASDCDADGYA